MSRIASEGSAPVVGVRRGVAQVTEVTALPDATGERASVRSVMAVVIVAGVVLASFVGLRLAAHDGDTSAFVTAGDGVTDPGVAPKEVTVARDSLGYDGQLFYRLTRNPATQGRHEFGIELVRPEYRHQRIGYPLLAWAGSLGGKPALAPWSMIVVNLAAGMALAGLAATYARMVGRSPWWGLVVVGWSGYLVALARDLSEVVAGAFLMAAFLALRRRSWAPAAAAMTAAALTRETTLVLPAAVLVGHALSMLPSGRWWSSLAARREGPPAWVSLVPLSIFGAWRFVLRLWWGPGANAENAPESFLVAPFVDLLRQLRAWLGQLNDGVAVLQLGQVLILLLVVVAVTGALRDPKAGLPHERVALVAGLVLLSMMPGWDRSVVYLRWANDVIMVGLLVALTATRFDLRRVAALVGAVWVLSAPMWILVL